MNLVHYLFSIAIYKFKSAHYGGAIIVCQGNFIIMSEARKLSGFVAHDLSG